MRFVICAEHIFLRLFICGVLTFLQTIALFLTVRLCGHRAFTICPVLWTPRFYRLSGFVDTLLFTVCPVLWTLPIQCSAKFHNIGISNNAILSVKDRLLLNIRVFTPNFPISQQRKIPEYWNFRQRNFERERQTFAKYHCFHAEFFYQPAAQNSRILEFPTTRF